MHALRQRESNLAVVELLHLRPAARGGLDYLHFDDLETEKDARFVSIIEIYTSGTPTTSSTWIIFIQNSTPKNFFFSKLQNFFLFVPLDHKKNVPTYISDV